MKIRTDFVTNSSSSSYIVTISVKPRNSGKLITLDYEDAYNSECVHYTTKLPIESLLYKIKSSSSVEELSEVLSNAINVRDREGDFEWELDHFEKQLEVERKNKKILEDELERCAEDPKEQKEIERKLKEAISRIESYEGECGIFRENLENLHSIPINFSKSLRKLKSLDKIEKVIIKQIFSGSGEFIEEAEDYFLKEFNIKDYDWSTASNRNKKLKELLEKHEFDKLKEMLERWYAFHATITKSIDFETGKITREFEY